MKNKTKKSKTAWDYQRGRYKQINIKFDMQNADDALLHHYIVDCTVNTTARIKCLIYDDMVRSAYYE